MHHRINHIRILTVQIATFFILIFTGCNRLYIREHLKKMIGSPITMPVKISMAYNGELSPPPESLDYRAKLIFYIDSSGCSLCRVSNLTDYQGLYDLSLKTKAFELIPLIAEGEIEGIPISRIVLDQEYDLPIYIDEDNKFLKDNPIIPPDKRFHSFFVDENKKIVFVGDPSSNSALMSLLYDYLNRE